MIGERQLLRSYLRGIRRLSGAGGISLFAPAPWGIAPRTLLIHDGPLPPLPELASLAAAHDFATTAAQRPAPGADLADDLSAEAILALRIPSRISEGVLVPVPTLYAALDALASSGPTREAPPAPLQRRRTDTEPEAQGAPTAWLGLRFEASAGSGMDALSLPRQLPDPTHWLVWLLALGGAIASHTAHVSAVLDDPISGLPGRAEFQESLAEALARSRATGSPLTLVMLNPDRFDEINDRFGRESGDAVVEEIAARLRLALRRTDLVAKYGGVVFAAVLPDTPERLAPEVVSKLLAELEEGAYLEGAVRLGFSAGLAGFHPTTDSASIADPLELIRRTDQALNRAKRSGGGKVVRWGVEVRSDEAATLDRLSGIFTGNLAKDYRNMVLLWETVSAIATSSDFEELAGEVAHRLCSAFRAGRVAIFRAEKESSLELVRGALRQPSTGSGTKATGVELDALPPAELALAREAFHRQALLGSCLPGVEAAESGPDHPALAIPLTARSQTLGCLYLDGPDEGLELDTSDLLFLKALGPQLGAAVDRALLAAQERVRQEQDRRRLQEELSDLRNALRQAKLLHVSPEMDEVLATVRRVAPTDATVLLIGESGTGKGVIARTLHRLSRRADRPLVEVDCGAISATLIDSELFGREKGAFTGAVERSRGRLAEADGGTVLLDEIGELPLEVQSKLLRFVQEHQVIAVGATRSRSVDARVVAATNRDLAQEVAAGRFRRDLYYRLNVVQIHVPPLRQRREDILVLAHHFLQQFALQYEKDVHGLTSRAEQALLAHSWPGNVRELQNRVMRAVILAETGLLGPEELGLEGALDREMPEASHQSPTAGFQAAGDGSGRVALAAPEAVSAGASPAEGPDGVEEALRRRLVGELDKAVGERSRALPLGTWLHEDLLLAAYQLASGVGRRAASLLGVPESTFRRRIGPILEQENDGLLPRPESWAEIRSLLAQWLETNQPSQEDLVDSARRLLLAEVARRFPEEPAVGARLMGVTPPTFRRWLGRADGTHG
jgi:hydrogenase-4 transcriptional activator